MKTANEILIDAMGGKDVYSQFLNYHLHPDWLMRHTIIAIKQAQKDALSEGKAEGRLNGIHDAVVKCAENAISAFPYGNMEEGFSNGMSKRLLLAGMAMQGLLAANMEGMSVESDVELSLKYADELLRQEGKEK